MRKNSAWWWVSIGLALGTFAFGVSRIPSQQYEIARAATLPAPHLPARPIVFTPEDPESLIAAEPSAEVPTLVEASDEQIEIRVKALAHELTHMWTRNPEELVVVIDDAARSMPSAPSVTLLLAIAHAETNGKILDVSEAGAVGLAQATPVAYRQEKFDGKLFVTKDYLVGSRAYIMKKPLGDADTIATLIVDHDSPATRAKARRLLAAAKSLRREGIDELDLLDPYASKGYFDEIKREDAHNKSVLKKLDKLIDNGSRAELRTFRNDVRKEYRALKATQLATWARYQKDLIAKRDRVLEKHFQMKAAKVKKEMAYEASEYLGEHLDDRFSAKSMAKFLVRHLDRKTAEARKLAESEDDVEAMTAALYNGGSHNVKRMLAGLIRSLPETEKYMRKVPATRRRLDGVIAGEMRTLR
ncbi:MAG: hypothetical protein DMF56_20810 [Acidobacteria bacterium]|nr:MAG: hypothetical protein DMF56_20810 [Acidobacteriota bacterium]